MIKKWIALTYLVIFGSGNIFSIGVSNKVVQISINYCSSKYSPGQLGLPRCIIIKNISDKPVTIDPSIISAPLVSYQQVVSAYKNGQKAMFLFLSGLTASSAALASIFKINLSTQATVQKPNLMIDNRLYYKLNLLSSGAGGSLAAYMLYKYLSEKPQDIEEELKKELLHESVVIQPGQQIKKLFWLKNRSGQVSINFNAVQVIK